MIATDTECLHSSRDQDKDVKWIDILLVLYIPESSFVLFCALSICFLDHLNPHLQSAAPSGSVHELHVGPPKSRGFHLKMYHNR